MAAAKYPFFTPIERIQDLTKCQDEVARLIISNISLVYLADIQMKCVHGTSAVNFTFDEPCSPT